MQLRPRQVEWVGKTKAALKKNLNTLSCACTGFGKTIGMAGVIGGNGGYERSLVLQHRDELLIQNEAKFRRFNPGAVTAVTNADSKRWASTGHNFAMVQTLVGRLDSMKPVDILAVDEGHHAAADSYRQIITRARELNPKTHLWLVTATPERADGKGLREIVDNVADVVTLAEMINARLLVRPRTYRVELGLGDGAANIPRGKNEFDPDAAAALMDLEPITERVFSEWKRLAGDRRTICFATNVAHSKHIVEHFIGQGVKAEHIDGDMSSDERRAILRRLKNGQTQFVSNVFVLTEGFDDPGVSCVLLNKPFMHRSMMVQCVGRGLRTIAEPDEYPGMVKDDCIVIDCGASIMTHLSLEAECSIDPRKKGGEAPMKECVDCGAQIPASCKTCPLCGAEFFFEGKDKIITGDFSLTEIDLMKLSPFQWETLWEDAVIMANAFTSWCALVNYKGLWFAYGGINGTKEVKLIAASKEKAIAMVKGDDYLREHGDKKNARKTRDWLHEDATDKQYAMLDLPAPVFGRMSKYQAACHINWRWFSGRIQASVLANFKNFSLVNA